MYFEYNGSSRNKVDKHNVYDLTNVSVMRWKSLAGLFCNALPDGFASFSDFKISGKLPTVRIEGLNPNFEIDMRCNLKTKSIYVFNFKINDFKKGFGFLAFKECIKRAKNMGFLFIRCKASAEKDPNKKKYAGYFVWGKFGFTMQTKYHQKFLLQIEKDGRKENCLQKLLYTKDGLDYWENYGTSWYAEFNLKTKSLNRRLLKKYERLTLKKALP